MFNNCSYLPRFILRIIFTLITWLPTELSRTCTTNCIFLSAAMISDNGLYRLAVFLGSAAVLLIVLYHFLEVNADKEPEPDTKTSATTQKDLKA